MGRGIFGEGAFIEPVRPASGAPEYHNVPTRHVQEVIASARLSPAAGEPLLPAAKAGDRFLLTPRRALVVLLHMASADAANTKLVRIVWVLHVVDVSD